MQQKKVHMYTLQGCPLASETCAKVTNPKPFDSQPLVLSDTMKHSTTCPCWEKVSLSLFSVTPDARLPTYSLNSPAPSPSPSGVVVGGVGCCDPAGGGVVASVSSEASTPPDEENGALRPARQRTVVEVQRCSQGSACCEQYPDGNCLLLLMPRCAAGSTVDAGACLRSRSRASLALLLANNLAASLDMTPGWCEQRSLTYRRTYREMRSPTLCNAYAALLLIFVAMLQASFLSHR
jgi:hypothetical protein